MVLCDNKELKATNVTWLLVQHNITTSHGSLYRTSSMASVATVTGGPITKEEDDKGEEGLLFLLEVAGFEQVAPPLAFWGRLMFLEDIVMSSLSGGDVRE